MGDNKKLWAAEYVLFDNAPTDPYSLAAAGAYRIYARIQRDWRALMREVIVEHPRVYFAKGKGDPNDLFALAALGGGLACLTTAKVTSVYPADWKGQVPKEVMTARIRNKLTPEELACVKLAGKTKDHNTFDAVGIFLWKEGRL